MSNDSNALVKVEDNLPQISMGGVFSNIKSFEDAQRMAKILASSQLIPKSYQGRINDCCIALEMAQRIGASPMAVLQNLYIVYGKPAWSSQFLISAINACGKFTPLRYKMTGEKGEPSYGCIAWTVDRYGETLEGPEVTIAMANAEGWTTKNGSKWKNMPELMLRYRAATFFSRLYCPELMMGLSTQDEIIDVSPVVTEARPSQFEQSTQINNAQCDDIPMDFPPVGEQEQPAKPKKRQLLTRRMPIHDTSEFELNLHTWLIDNAGGISTEQIKAKCDRDNVPFDSGLFTNDAEILKSFVQTILG